MCAHICAAEARREVGVTIAERRAIPCNLADEHCTWVSTAACETGCPWSASDLLHGGTGTKPARQRVLGFRALLRRT